VLSLLSTVTLTQSVVHLLNCSCIVSHKKKTDLKLSSPKDIHTKTKPILQSPSVHPNTVRWTSITKSDECIHGGEEDQSKREPQHGLTLPSRASQFGWLLINRLMRRPDDEFNLKVSASI
jgi:hypothetical protein